MYSLEFIEPQDKQRSLNNCLDLHFGHLRAVFLGEWQTLPFGLVLFAILPSRYMPEANNEASKTD